MSKKGFQFRDVSVGLQKLRAFLLGRKHVLHGRFPPAIAPRTIPTPDLFRGGLDFRYAKKYYYERNALNSVNPPVIAPIAEGPPISYDPTKKAPVGGIRPDVLCFSSMPTPGLAWWWDGHCYYECEPDSPPRQSPSQQADPYCPQERPPK